MQLSHMQSMELIHKIREFGDPLPQLILTGGDPLERSDLFTIIDEAVKLGIGVSITPAASASLTLDLLRRLQFHGVEALGLSLDGSTPQRHDSIRQIAGTFDRTIRAMEWARDLGMPLQINTLASEETADDIPAIYELLKSLAVTRWSLFFLISVGRGKVLQPLTIEKAEELMEWTYETSLKAPFIVATTEAPSYRRVAIRRMRESGFSGEEIKRSPAARGFNIRDGNGILFISNTGDICPAGFLPIAAGNVKTDSIVDIYRNSPLFQSLHDPSQFEGVCGDCRYHALCGGSRARAYAATGNPLAGDPLCLGADPEPALVNVSTDFALPRA